MSAIQTPRQRKPSEETPRQRTAGAKARTRQARVVMGLDKGDIDKRLAVAVEVMEEVMSSRATRNAWLLGFLAGSGVSADQLPD